MKISFVGHAAILVEAGGVRVLSDPWWRAPCFGAQWWNYPPADLGAVTEQPLDYIYVSHGHHDHLHHGTLKSLPRSAKVLVSSALDLAAGIRELGFEVIEIGPDEEFTLGAGGLKCRLKPTYALDTMMVLSDGEQSCANINDALHSAPASVQAAMVEWLRAHYGVIDYVFCGYGTASHFPNCYSIPGKNRVATAALRQSYFNRQWARLIEDLSPRFGFPFAADVVFLEESLQWVNEPSHNAERPTDAFRKMYPASKVQTYDVAPGFVIEDGKVLKCELRKPILMTEVLETMGEQVTRANYYGRISEEDVDEVGKLVSEVVGECREYLQTYEGDYRFMVRLHNTLRAVIVEKLAGNVDARTLDLVEGNVPDCDLVYRTRLHYLKRSLTEKYGNETLFVGSGGIFEYQEQSKARRNLHRELQLLLKRRQGSLPSRYGQSSRNMFRAKELVKKLMGIRRPDLYDLGAWTVFDKQR